MPFQFSVPRTKQAPLSRGRVGEFERLPPSSFRYQAVSKQTGIMASVLHSFWHCYVISLFVYKFHQVSAYVSTSVKSAFVPLKISECIPLNLPDIGVCFNKGIRITAEMSTILSKYDGMETTHIISKKKSWNVHICRGVLLSDLAFFKGIAKYTDPTYRGSSELITPNQIDGYMTIISILSVQLISHRNGYRASGANAGMPKIGLQDGTPRSDVATSAVIDDETDFSEVPHMEGEVGKVSTASHDSKCRIVWNATDKPTIHPAWGSLSLFKWSRGLALPFVTDVSMPDRTGISSLLQSSLRLLDRKTVDPTAPTLDKLVMNLDRDWREGIMSTPQGEWISHICASLELASRVNAAIFCVISNGRYLGSVIGGGDYFILSHGKVYVEAQGNDFDLELDSLNAHQNTLLKVMALLKMPEGQVEPVSLRDLRSRIHPKDFDGETQNKVSELLPYLDFGSSIEPINTTAIKMTLTLLSLEDPMVPKEKYMDPESFWSEDKETMVLSMFGRRAPVFSTGQQQRKLTIAARGQGSSTVAAYDSTPPSVLQMTTKPLGEAVRTWKGLLSSGMAKGDWTQEIRGNIVFRGQAKGEIWAKLNESLLQVLGKEETEGDRQKRKADDGDLEEGEIADVVPKPKKAKEAFSFF